MPVKPWTRAEDALLKQLWPTGTASAIARRLKRNSSQVYVRAKRLRLQKVVDFWRRRAATWVSNGRHINGGAAWTRAELAVLRKGYANTSAQDLAARLHCSISRIYAKAGQLGLKKSAAFLSSSASGRLTAQRAEGLGARFPKGHVPWNKGMKGLVCGGVATQFKKGQVSARWAPEDYLVGTLRLNADGYVDMKVKEGPRAWRAFHRMVWEDQRGPIPPGHVLVFRDGDPLNICVDNMELISRGENARRNIQKYHALPGELKSVIILTGKLRRAIDEKQDRGSAQSPVCHAGGAAGPG